MTEQEITNAGLRVYTTLDVEINDQAQRAVADGITRLEKRFKLPPTEKLEGALATVDQKNGLHSSPGRRQKLLPK